MEDIFKSLGKIFYRYVSEDDISIYRIVGFSGNKTVKAKIIEPEKDKGNIIQIPYKTVCEEYTFLIPDSMVIVSDVNVGTRNTDDGMKLSVSDIIVASYRIGDINAGITEPWAVCRQNITDLFSQIMVNNPEDALVGMSTTKDSMPAGVDYEIMMACESMNKSVMVNTYITDTLDEFLSLFKTTPFDRILEGNTIEHIRAVESKLNRKLRLKPGVKSVDGYCITLQQLLKENNFWNDVERGFNILSINKPIELGDDKESLSDNMRFELSTILHKAIGATMVIKYDMDIDLSEFRNREYVLLRDSNKGDYIEPDLENEQTKEEINNIMGIVDVDKSKYVL